MPRFWEQKKPLTKSINVHKFLKNRLTDDILEALFRLLKTTLPGSSVVEQVTVNHPVAGSIPARAANLDLRENEGLFCGRFRNGIKKIDT